MTGLTYQHLLEIVDGDDELIVRLVEEGIIQHGADVVPVDLDAVLLARTLWRDLQVEWPGIEIILRLSAELAEAHRRIRELEGASR